jgi:hypothetical protein
MAVIEDTGFQASGEVDELRWATAGEALALLSYEDDRRLVRALSSPG